MSYSKVKVLNLVKIISSSRSFHSEIANAFRKQLKDILIEKIHLYDLDVLDTLKLLWSSLVKLAKKFNSTSFNLKREVFIRRDEV